MKAINGLVESYTFGVSRFNVMTLSIELKLANSGGVVALGDICLGDTDPMYNLETKNDYMAYFITKILEVFNVKTLNDIVGKPVRVIFENNASCGNSCIGLQSFLNDGIFFIPNLKEEDDISGILDEDYLNDLYLRYKDDCLKRQNIWKSHEYYEKLVEKTTKYS